MLITYQTEIQAARETVFSYLEDNEKQKQWMQGLEGTEQLSETKFKQRLREGGKVQEYVVEVIDFQKNKLLAVHLTHSAFEIDVKYELEALTNTSCRLLVTETMQAKSAVGRLMNFLFRPMVKGMLKKQITLLKQAAERENVNDLHLA